MKEIPREILMFAVLVFTLILLLISLHFNQTLIQELEDFKATAEMLGWIRQGEWVPKTPPTLG